MKHFLLFYDYVPDYAEQRAPHRAAHLELARAAAARGELVLGGAVPGDPALGLLLFKAESSAAAEAFAAADPYVKAGLVRSWRVREWITTVGEAALTPA